MNGTQEHKNNNFKVFVLKFHFFYDINILGCICKYIWHRKIINHFYFKTISECFLSKTIKNRVFLFYKLRNHVQDLSSYQAKKEKYKFVMKSHHICVYLVVISYVTRRKKLMHNLVSVSEIVRPSVLLLTLNGTPGVRLVTVNGTLFCVQFLFLKHIHKGSKLL